MTDSAAAPSPFVHLRLHTAYSLSEGAIRIATLPDLCATNRMPALAITDTNNLFGALEFAETMIDAGIQPIIGCSLDLLWPLEQDATGRIGAPHVPQRRDRNLPALALLAQSEPGYRNLMALTTAAYRRGREDNLTHISLEDLRRHGEGLIALTGGREGPVDTLLMRNMGDRARDLVAELAPIFPDRLYVELQRHGDEVSELTLPHLVAFAYELGLPLVATNQPYFTEPALARAHDALLCISQEP